MIKLRDILFEAATESKLAKRIRSLGFTKKRNRNAAPREVPVSSAEDLWNKGHLWLTSNGVVWQLYTDDGGLIGSGTDSGDALERTLKQSKWAILEQNLREFTMTATGLSDEDVETIDQKVGHTLVSFDGDKAVFRTDNANRLARELKALGANVSESALVAEAKFTRFYVRHPLDLTKAVRVLKKGGIASQVGKGNVLQISSKDMPKAVEILNHHKVDFEPTRKRFKTD